ncbi:MAG: hypothetical protein AB7E71_04860 [Dongiaceae bacterium]
MLPFFDRGEARMFELLVIACVNGKICEYQQLPPIYASEQVCAQQAAIIAGMIHARHDIGGTLSYKYRCSLAEVATQQIVRPVAGRHS